ncbi:hypothetical protein LINPERHAP1_LOCUS7017 [Linum perenne]
MTPGRLFAGIFLLLASTAPSTLSTTAQSPSSLISSPTQSRCLHGRRFLLRKTTRTCSRGRRLSF